MIWQEKHICVVFFSIYEGELNMGSVFPRGKSWIGKYKDENGNWKKKTLGRRDVMTKTMAREEVKDLERKVAKGRHEEINATIPVLSEFSKEYSSYKRDVEQIRSWRTTRDCLKNINSLLGNRKLSNISPKDIDDYKKLRLRSVRPTSVDRDLIVLRNLFNLARRWKKFFGENPVTLAGLILEDNKRERIATRDEETRLLGASPPHLRNILITALQTGMRKGEIIKLKWENVDIDNNLIIIDKISSKSKKSRKIPINSVLRKLLLVLKLKNMRSDFVFLHSDGNPYRREDSLNQIYRTALRRAGIKGLRFHDLRHTAGTRLGELGVPVQVIKEILGHADIRTTLRYVHPGDSVRDAIELLAVSSSDGLKFGLNHGKR